MEGREERGERKEGGEIVGKGEGIKISEKEYR